MARIVLIAGIAAAGALTGGLAWAGFLPFGIGGALLPAILGGASLGAAAGSVLSSTIFPQSINTFPPVNNLNTMSAAEGTPIPWGYGGYRIGGQVIWAQTMKVYKNQQSSGGKGGGPTSTVYTYTISAVISFGFGPGSITRIWADSKLIYDVTHKGPITIDTGLSTSNGNTITVPFSPTLYQGSATQDPDPTIQAVEGVETTSGYRDQIYMVLTNFPLADYGNRLPNFSAEITSSTALSYITDVYPSSFLAGVSGVGAPTFSHIDYINRVAYIENQYGQVVQKIDLDVATGTPADPYQTAYAYTAGDQILDTNGNIQVSLRTFTSPGPDVTPPQGFETGFGDITDEVNTDTPTWQCMGPGPDVVPITLQQVLAWPSNTTSPGVINIAGYIGIVDTAGFFWTQGWQDNYSGGTGFHLLRFNPATLQFSKSIYIPEIGGPDLFSAVTRVKSPSTGKNYLYYLSQNNQSIWVVDADNVEVVNKGQWQFSGATSTSDSARSPAAVDPKTGIAYLVFNPSDGVTGVGAYDLASGTSVATLWTNTYSYSDYGSGVHDYGDALFFDQTDSTLIMLTEQGCIVKLSTVDGSIISYTGAILISGADIRVIQAKGFDCLIPSTGIIPLLAPDNSGSFKYIQSSDLSVIKTVALSNWMPILGGDAITWFSYDALTNSALVNASSSNYGNFTVRIYFDRQAVASASLQSVVEDIWARTGADPALLDASALSDIQVQGYPITSNTTGKNALGPLQVAYFFDMVETDNVLKAVLRGQPVTTSIPEDDLGLLKENVETIPTIVQEQDLPLFLDVVYYDPALDYQQGKQTYRRNKRAKKTRNKTNVSLPLVLTADTAAAIGAQALQTAWAERNQWELKTWKLTYLVMDPSDVIEFTYNGNLYQARIGKTSVGADKIVEVQAVSEDPLQYTTTAKGAQGLGFTSGTISPTPQSAFFVLDIPFLTDGDANPASTTGYYWSMAPATKSTGWAGGVLLDSSDNNVFVEVGAETTEVTYGQVYAALPAPRTLWSWDTVNTVQVYLNNGESLTSATLLQVLNGTNMFYLGGELCGFCNATLQADGSYILDTLLRGLRGTEGWCSTHGTDEVFVLLNTAQQRQVQPTSVLNVTQYFRGVTIGQPQTSVASTPIALTGNDLRPYAPAQLEGTIDGSSNINISWVRRTRLGGTWIDGTGTVPLSEETESYDVDICPVSNNPAVTNYTLNPPVALQTYNSGTDPAYLATRILGVTITWEDGVSAYYGYYDYSLVNAVGLTGFIYVHDASRVGAPTPNAGTFVSSSTPINTPGYWYIGYVTPGNTDSTLPPLPGGRDAAIRTISGLGSPAYQYTAAQQTTDFGSTQTSIRARVFQNSAAVGRGFPADNSNVGNGTVVSGGSDATSILGATISGTAADGDVLQFNEATGEWLIVGPLLKRVNQAKTTASLANNAAETGTFAIGCGTFAILAVGVDRAARVQLYSTAAFRDADSSRGYNVPPADGAQTGIIADFGLMAGGAESWVCSPPLVGANMDASPADQIYYRVTNLSGSTSAVTATITIVPLEVI